MKHEVDQHITPPTPQDGLYGTCGTAEFCRFIHWTSAPTLFGTATANGGPVGGGPGSASLDCWRIGNHGEHTLGQFRHVISSFAIQNCIISCFLQYRGISGYKYHLQRPSLDTIEVGFIEELPRIGTQGSGMTRELLYRACSRWTSAYTRGHLFLPLFMPNAPSLDLDHSWAAACHQYPHSLELVRIDL